MKEEDLYKPVKEAFEKKHPKISLEITAKKIPDNIKSILDDDALAIINKEGSLPDLMGWADDIFSKKIVIVETKINPPTLTDIYQVKRYAEVFSARYTFLVSAKKISEEHQRFLSKKLHILSYSAGYHSIFLLSYSVEENELYSDEKYPSHYLYNHVKKEIS